MSSGSKDSVVITENNIEKCEILEKPINQDYPFEYNVYALALKSPGAITYFEANLPAELVGLPTNTGLHELYLAFLDFYRRTGLDPVDSITFKEWLINESDFANSLGGVAVLGEYLNIFQDIELSTPESVVKYLKFKANKLKQKQSVQELQLILSKKEVKTSEDRLKLTKLTEQIRDLENTIGYNPLEKITTSAQIVDHLDTLWELPNFISTPYPSLNRALGYNSDSGLIRQGVYSVIAPSGKGKTTLVRCFCNHFLNNGLRVLFMNYEEPQEHWERILLTQITKMNVYAGADVEQQVRCSKIFVDKMEEWGDRYMICHHPDTNYFEDLEQWLRDVHGHNENLPDVIVIDTIQSLQTKKSSGPRWGEFEYMMIRLEKIAKDMDCAVIITSQENNTRASEKREMVEQRDAGGSAVIIHKSTAAIFITPKKIAGNDDSINANIMQIQIPKNRITGSVFLNDAPLLRYNDDIKGFEEFDFVGAKDYKDWADFEIKDLEI